MLCTSVEDLPIPEFDNIGMEAVPATTLFNSNRFDGTALNDFLGYNPRYWPWQSKIDRVHGAFTTTLIVTGNLLTRTGTWNYKSMKVFPQQLNSIFQPQVTTSTCSVAQDQLICNVNFQVYAAQNVS